MFCFIDLFLNCTYINNNEIVYIFDALEYLGNLKDIEKFLCSLTIGVSIARQIQITKLQIYTEINIKANANFSSLTRFPRINISVYIKNIISF